MFWPRRIKVITPGRKTNAVQNRNTLKIKQRQRVGTSSFWPQENGDNLQE
jgi:hypothetical protein